MGRSLVVVAIGALVVVVLAGAGTSANNQAVSGTDKTPEAIRAVTLFTPSSEEAFARLDGVIDGGGIRLAALRPYLASANLQRRWAAVYIVSNLATKQSDYVLLKRPFHDRNRTVRALASFALLGGGKKEAIPALIELLPFDDLLLYWEPPIPIAVAADYRLTSFTGARFKLDYTASSANRRATAARWRLWWKAVKGNIRWDRRAHKYRWRKSGLRPSSFRSTPALPRTGAAQLAPAAPLTGPVDPVSVNPDTGTVTVNIEFVRDPGVSKSDRAAIQNAINNAVKFMNGPGRTGACTKIELKIDARFKGPDPPFPAGSKPIVIKVVPGASGNRAAGQRSNIDLPHYSGTWRVEDLKAPYAPTVVAHEVTHVMDLKDEYREGQGPLDKESYMAAVVPGGKMLQRHLDALAEKWLKDRNARCQKYEITFVPWTTHIDAWDQQVGSRHDYYIGRTSKANIFADFWVNPDTGEITPAGETPCADKDLNPKAKQMSQADFDKCKKESFPQGLGGNSELLGLSANPGTLPCSLVQLTATRQRFRTTVKGRKQATQLNLQLDVPDSETASYVCNPQAQGGFKQDITLGMTSAGALSFAITAPALGGVVSRAFSAREAHGSANGTARVVRLK